MEVNHEEITNRFKNWIQKQHHYSKATKQNYLAAMNRVNLEDLHGSLEKLKSTSATKTYNLTITALKHVANVTEEPLRSELKDLKKLRHENVKHHLPYTASQRQEILAAAKGWKYQALCLAFYAGLRKGEIQRLNIQDFDFDRRRIRVLGKGGKVRHVTVTKAEFAEILKWKKLRELKLSLPGDLRIPIGDNWLFTSTGRRPSLQSGSVFKTISAKVGYPVKLHSARKTYAISLYRATNHNLRMVQMQLGHSSIETTQIYLNISDSELEREVQEIRRLYF